jgi:HEAT repeat protein
MKHLKLMLWTAALLLVAAPALAQQSDGVYGWQRTGEVSPDTQAPSRETLMNAIQAGNANPTALEAMLEYGERVECHECVPLLQRQLLASNNVRVRQIAAWWLARRPIEFSGVFHAVRTTLASDPDATNRARAAEALGGFREPNGAIYLREALSDTDVGVRVAAVRSLGELYTPMGNQAITVALTDSDPAVREAAAAQTIRVSYFQDGDSLLGLLADTSAAVQRRAALAVGTLRVAEAVPALAAILSGSGDTSLRQAAAWALGRIGGSAAQSALTAQQGTETQSLVRDAIGIALRMRH